MSRPQVRIYQNNGDFIDREMNDEEFAQWQKDQQQAVAEAQAKAEAEAKRSAALAKLEALGLDEDDLKALGL